jgi:hypothetical protein
LHVGNEEDEPIEPPQAAPRWKMHAGHSDAVARGRPRWPPPLKPTTRTGLRALDLLMNRQT